MKPVFSHSVRILALLAVAMPIRGGVEAAPVCTDCPVGKYCEGGRKAPLPCPKGHYCPAWAPGMNAKWPCPDGTYNDEEGKSTEGDCKTCNGMINDDKTACGACPAGKKSDGAGGCGDCPEFEYPDGADACKSYGEILSKQLDDIYAAAKQDIPNYSSLTCTTSNKYEGIMSDKISDKSKLETPWGKPIRVRGGSDCGCVDIYIMNLDKKNCEHLVGLNDSFKSKAIWCSGYSIKANHGDRPCSDDDANEVRFYYKPW